MQLFVKKFYGFSPTIVPVITFSQIGSRNSLLARSKPGDRIVYVSVKGDSTLVEAERGKILGMAEIGREKVDTLDMVPDPSLLNKDHFVNGKYMWPEGIPMLRAWRFTPALDRMDIFDKEVIDSQALRSNAVLLSAEEQEKIMSLSMQELELPHTPLLDHQRARARILSPEFRDMWSKDVARMADTIRDTVERSNGQEVIRAIKEKNIEFNTETDLQLFLREKLDEQKGVCAITGQALLPHQPESWLAPSADRIDSDGHYTRDNIQIVSKAANRAKSDIASDKVQDFFAALQLYDPSPLSN